MERRLRSLQRIAYGADSSDADRARAAAELTALAAAEQADRDTTPTEAGADADAPVDAEVATAAAESSGQTAGVQAAGSDAAELAQPPAAPVDDHANRRRVVRWAAVAGLVGISLGAALGWTAGQRVPERSTSSPTLYAEWTPAPGVPLGDTLLLPLFDRLPLADEAPRVAGLDDDIDESSVRLLAVRTDGPSAYFVRTVDGVDVCLVLVLPNGPFRRACTVNGIFPLDGLAVEYGARGYGLAVARLSSAGTVALGLRAF
ncbi:hypothetical protein EV187_2793 [Agromyces ramosus]|uniref:Uncharacterized protein n=1 Tax=Agromyces ramosus TaxID=33879 RepID=A0A4Q7MAS8_9MICO|nr:hypothetical protein [Agromyces ramosus]RZS64407.1 hypothetical protein EV187_2793 [Agromyces ramosus]